MAEAVAAVGLAASIVQIISTGIQASVYLYNFAETVSSAGKALREIADDISFTTSVLEQLRAILESERHYGTATKEALTTADHLVRECSAVFETIMTLLKKHFPAPEPGRTKRAKLNTLKWPFLQPKIEVMRSNLEKHKTKLIWMTQVLTYAKMAASEQRNLEDEMERERQKLEALVIVSHRVKARSKCKVNPIGLTEVFNPSAPASVDVVFVHGIFGHPKDTWTCAEEDVFWPAELLPPILEDEGTRVLTYGYEAGADAFADGGSRHKIHEVIAKLGIDLASNRQVRKASTRPLVWVAHSLGGLIVKGVLSDSSRSSEQAFPNLRPISVSTYGVIFLSTPHTILPSHIDLLCQAAIHKGVFQIAQNIERLRAKHTALTALNREFLDLAHQYQLHCFREILEPVILDDIAARLSELHAEATCIHSDHYSITKFSSDNSPGFDLQAPQQMRQHTQRMQRPVYQQYQAPLVQQQQQQLALAHQMAMQQAVSQTQGQHVSQPPPPASQKQGVLVQQHMAMQGAQVPQAQAHAQAQAQAQAQIQAQAQVQAGQGQAQNQAHQAVPDYNNMKSHGTESSKHKFFKSNRSQALLPGIQERRGSYQPFPTNSLQWPAHPPLSAYYRPSSTDFPLQSPAFLPSSAASYPSPYDAPLQFPAFSTPSAASCPLSPDDKDKNDSLARKYEPESPMACNYWELDATKLYQSNHHGRNVSRGSQSHRMSPSPRSSLGPTINLPNPTHNAAGSPRVDEDLNKLNPNVQEAPAKSERKKKRRFLGFGESSNKEATVTAAAHNQALNQANQQAQDQALAQGYVQNPMPMISVSAREVYNTPTAGKSFSPPIPLRFSSSFSGGQQQQRSSSTGSDLRPQGVTDEYPDPVAGAPVPPASPPPSGYEPFRPWASFGQQIAPIPIIDHSHKPSLKWMRGEERTSNFRQRKKDQSMVQMSVEVGSAEYPSTSTGYFSRETISELSPLRDETGTPMNLKPMEEDIVAPRQGRRTQSTSHSDSTKPFLAYPARNFKSKDETSPPSEGKMEPIKLKDAVGREFSFPFGLCSTWLGMKDLVNELFSDVPFIGPRVAEGRYDLLGPNNEIVLPAVWETTIESGWTLTMHMWPLPQPKSEELATENMKCPRRKVNSVMRGRPPPPLPAIPLHSNLNMTFGPMDTGALLHESDFDSLLQHNNRHVDFVPSSTNFAEPLRMQRPGRAGIQADSSAESLQRPEKGPLVVPEQELGDEGPRNPLSPDLQNLDATEEERAKAKEEVMKLLRQWTTFDASRLENIGRNGGLAVAMEIDSVG